MNGITPWRTKLFTTKLILGWVALKAVPVLHNTVGCTFRRAADGTTRRGSHKTRRKS